MGKDMTWVWLRVDDRQYRPEGKTLARKGTSRPSRRRSPIRDTKGSRDVEMVALRKALGPAWEGCLATVSSPRTDSRLLMEILTATVVVATLTGCGVNGVSMSDEEASSYCAENYGEHATGVTKMVASGAVPSALRAAGYKTVYWYCNPRYSSAEYDSNFGYYATVGSEAPGCGVLAVVWGDNRFDIVQNRPGDLVDAGADFWRDKPLYSHCFS